MFMNILQKLFGDSQGEFSDRQGCVVPDVIENENNTKITIPQKFKADLDALKTYLNTEFESGLCINLTLSEILGVCPRERRRIDAYKSLCNFLKEKLGVELNIKSQKTK